MKYINDLFDNMDSWRNLPAYQLERRADIFFSIYLPDLFLNRFGVQIESAIPEFPIRIGTIGTKSESNQSFKVDYLVKAKNVDKVFLVELKTDDRSRRINQDTYLKKAMEVGLPELLGGLRNIYKATKSRKKYRQLLSRLNDMNLIILEDPGKFRISKANYNLEIVYIQPNHGNNGDNVISFKQAAEIIRQHQDPLSLRFSESLLTWAEFKAGEE